MTEENNINPINSFFSYLAIIGHLAADFIFDRLNGISTGWALESAYSTVPEHKREHKSHQATPYIVISRVLSIMSDSDKRGVFADLGCGKGRVLFEARKHGFSRLLGIEKNHGLAARAGENMKGKAEVQETTAERAVIPDDTSVVFMFNPFGRKTMSVVTEKISAIKGKKPAIIYVNPIHGDLLEKIGYSMEAELTSLCTEYNTRIYR